MPPYHFREPSAEQRSRQIKLKRKYETLAELIRFILAGTPEDLCRQFDDADKRFRRWLELGNDSGISPDSRENEQGVRDAGKAFDAILSPFSVGGGSNVFVVPDTNAMLAAPDPTAYRKCVAEDSFTFVLLPEVLRELDRLKVEHRNQAVREKAQKAIARIKGWRLQGSLADGVTVDRSLTVRAIHREPDMKRSPSWLDTAVPDDRIIASILGLEAQEPSARVVLVTVDVEQSGRGPY